MEGLRVLIAGGGTGGHLFPAVALADEILERGGTVRFVGTAAGLEARILPEKGYDLKLIRVSGLKRVGLVGILRGLLRLPAALIQAVRIVREFRPDVVVGVGGYASGPVVLAAALLGYPTAIMEQNSIPGLTNRILGRLVRRIYIALEAARSYFPSKRTVLLGNPVRRGIREIARRRASAQAQGAPSAAQTTAPLPSAEQGRGSTGPSPGQVHDGADVPVLLAVGGSQGAHVLNEQLAAAVEILAARGGRFRLTHQTGTGDLDAIATRYRALDPSGDVLRATAFIDDMASAYEGASLLFGRAGATTLAEICAIGLPAVLVPFPYAADNHQEVNARVLEAKGAAVVILQRDLTPERLADTLGRLLADKDALARMASATRALGRPEAAGDIYQDLTTLGRHRRHASPEHAARSL